MYKRQIFLLVLGAQDRDIGDLILCHRDLHCDCLLYTSNGGQLRYLTPGQSPKAVFALGGEKPVAVYAYCNLHGLWMTKL